MSAPVAPGPTARGVRYVMPPPLPPTNNARYRPPKEKHSPVLVLVFAAGPVLWWWLIQNRAAEDDKRFLRFLTASYRPKNQSWEANRLAKNILMPEILSNGGRGISSSSDDSSSPEEEEESASPASTIDLSRFNSFFISQISNLIGASRYPFVVTLIEISLFLKTSSPSSNP